MSHAKHLHNRRYFKDDYLEIINRRGLPGNVKTELCQQVRQTVVTTVQRVIEQALEEELRAYLGLARYERRPWGRPPESTRSGKYRRALLTQYGGISALRVPKLRRGNGALSWQTITRYERWWGPLLDQHSLGYCLGLSLRDLQEMMQVTVGELMSLAACNRLVLMVQEQGQAFKATPLEAPPPIVVVDGMWVKIAYPTGAISEESLGRRRRAKRKQKRVGLSALGVWPDGHWDIVHWQIAPGETAETWQAFFGQLSAKGITPETTALVVSDGAKGIERALDRSLPGVPHQRWIFHKIHNLATHVVFDALEVESTVADDQALRTAKRARKKSLLADARWIYEGADAADIAARAQLFVMIWKGREPEAVAHWLLDFHKTVAYLRVDVSPALVPLIRTTNLLERFHKEGRRKQRDIGMLQSEQGCDAVWYLLAMRETAKQQAALKHRP